MPYALVPMYRQHVSMGRQHLTMLANFVEVFLAKEGHDGMVGINLLTKLQLPNFASLYGAMLADVDYVLMSAGIPREIPFALDRLAKHQAAALRFDVEGQPTAEATVLTFDPQEHGADASKKLPRPQFLAIVAASSLAAMLARNASGRVDGFTVEGPSAGGHNAPARGGGAPSASGEPIYGKRDAVDLAKMRELGLPFWLARGTGSPKQLQHALDENAIDIQVGTLFAYSDEGGFASELKEAVLSHARTGELTIRTDPRTRPDPNGNTSASLDIFTRPISVTMAASVSAARRSRWRITSRKAARSPKPKAGNACATVSLPPSAWRSRATRATNGRSSPAATRSPTSSVSYRDALASRRRTSWSICW